MNTTPTIEQIKETLVQELGVEHLTPTEQDDIITQMSTVILDRITIAMVAELPQSEMTRVDTLLEAGQVDAVQSILTKHVPNAQALADKIINETIGEYHATIEGLTEDK